MKIQVRTINHIKINREPDRICTRLRFSIYRGSLSSSFVGLLEGVWNWGHLNRWATDFRVPNVQGLQCFCFVFTKLNEISVKGLQPSLILKKKSNFSLTIDYLAANFRTVNNESVLRFWRVRQKAATKSRQYSGLVHSGVIAFMGSTRPHGEGGNFRQFLFTLVMYHRSLKTAFKCSTIGKSYISNLIKLNQMLVFGER